MSAHIGLIALWTGELCANVEHIKDMAIHEMDEVKLERFADFVRHAGYALASIAKYIKEEQERS
jgi:hypothetical protein